MTNATVHPEPAADWSWRRLTISVAVVVVFAAGMLQFALLKWYHLPAVQRINNGSQPTFFAFHIGPFYNFSEDFHLYYLRAKRIARRGWTDSLFYSRPNERPNYAAPLQVALGRLALLTEGRPRRYSVYMFVTSAIAWSTLLLSARFWLPREISSASILLALLVTVLFGTLYFVFHEAPSDEFGQWPAFRALRMSTMAWTNPLLVAVMIGATSLMYNRRHWGVSLAALLLMLLALSGTDNWAFAMAWGATGIVAAWLGVTSALASVREGGWPHASLPVLFGLAIALLMSFAIHEQLNTALTGDALLRGGFGRPWRGAEEQNVSRMDQWVAQEALLPLLAVLLLSVAEVRASQADARKPLHLTTSAWAHCRWLAVLPLITTLCVSLILQHSGMEGFLRRQLYWRAEYCLLFALTLTAAEWLRTSLPALFRRGAASWPVVVAVLLVGLFGYHNYRIHWFVTNTAARDFFLTADAQALVHWLERFDRQHDRYELATPSLELNYLSAFWTNADLWLPSGFPYHGAASNQEIQDRTVQLLRLYGTSQQSWLRFTEPTNEHHQDLWLKSRVHAAGRGYLYHLFHRWTYCKRPENTNWFEMGRMEIAAALLEPVTQHVLPTPEIILVDDVSRALGQPDLTGYRLAHRGGNIEAWVRSDVPSTE